MVIRPASRSMTLRPLASASRSPVTVQWVPDQGGPGSASAADPSALRAGPRELAVTDRSGCGLVERAVLEVLDTVIAGRPRAYMPSAKALARIEERIGLGPRYAYELMLDLARPWIIPVRTVAVTGNYGDRSFPPAGPEYTECRPSHAGQVDQISQPSN
jgi:hypothetical protein